MPDSHSIQLSDCWAKTDPATGMPALTVRDHCLIVGAVAEVTSAFAPTTSALAPTISVLAPSTSALAPSTSALAPTISAPAVRR